MPVLRRDDEAPLFRRNSSKGAVAIGERPSLDWLWPLVVTFPFLVASTLKTAGLKTVAGIDLTLGTYLALLAASVAVAVKYGTRIHQLWPLAVVAVTVAWGGLRLGPSDYALTKLIEFFLLTLPASVAVVILVRSCRDLRSVNLAWPAWAILATVAMLFAGRGLVQDERLSLDGTGATAGTIGYAMGAALVWVLVRQLSDRRAILPLLLPALVLLFGVYASGSRGALLGVAIAALVAVVLSPAVALRWKVLVIASLALIAPLLVSLVPDAASSRLSLDDSVRSSAWVDAWSGWLEAPLLGHGLGSFSSISAIRYPHNIILELGYELGLLGVAAFLVTMLVSGRRIWLTRDSMHARTVAAIAAFWLGGSLVSLDLRNRLLWVSLALCLSLPSIVRGSALPAQVSTRQRMSRRTPRVSRKGQVSPSHVRST